MGESPGYLRLRPELSSAIDIFLFTGLLGNVIALLDAVRACLVRNGSIGKEVPTSQKVHALKSLGDQHSLESSCSICGIRG
jgi:hypothetical protein